ncbi:Nucleotidyltransferase [Neoconidiobolus thromboides FSU 785]|nr:Nucleotidyltransferase [Neoconidiobolus thromboides FSU 785]
MKPSEQIELEIKENKIENTIVEEKITVNGIEIKEEIATKLSEDETITEKVSEKINGIQLTNSEEKEEVGNSILIVEEEATKEIETNSEDNFTRLSQGEEEEEEGVVEELLKEQELQLNIDMITLFESVTLSKKNYEKRKLLIEKVQGILNREYPEVEIKVSLFGSSENGLGMKMSDVDICILTPWDGFNDVRLLAELLKRNGFSNINCISQAKVPIIKAWDPQLKLACDINVNNPLAIHNTELIKCYVNIDPRVQPLAITIKYWAKQRVLNDAAAGGTLSTYSWVNLILNFLQTRQPPILPVLHQLPYKKEMELGVDVGYFKNISLLKGFGLANKETLGGLLFAFFKKFGYEFDYDNQIISLREGKLINKIDKGWDQMKGNFSLCIEEVFNVERNIGNSCDLISRLGLISEFQRGCKILSQSNSLYELCQGYYDEVTENLNYFDGKFLNILEDDWVTINEHIYRQSTINGNNNNNNSNNNSNGNNIVKVTKKDGQVQLFSLNNSSNNTGKDKSKSGIRNRK